MSTTKVVALLVALLLTGAEYLVFELDAQQQVEHYQAESIGAVAQHC